MVSFSFRITRLGKNRKDLCGRCLKGPGKSLKIWEKRQLEETSQSAAFGVPVFLLNPGSKQTGRLLKKL